MPDFHFEVVPSSLVVATSAPELYYEGLDNTAIKFNSQCNINWA